MAGITHSPMIARCEAHEGSAGQCTRCVRGDSKLHRTLDALPRCAACRCAPFEHGGFFLRCRPHFELQRHVRSRHRRAVRLVVPPCRNCPTSPSATRTLQRQNAAFVSRSNRLPLHRPCPHSLASYNGLCGQGLSLLAQRHAAQRGATPYSCKYSYFWHNGGMARKNKEDDSAYTRAWRKKKGKMYFRRYLRAYRKRKQEGTEEKEVIIW